MKMKGFSITIIFLLLAVICTTCTKDEALLTPEGEHSVLKKAKSSNYIPGEDITLQLRSDLEEGLSVTLPAGHFYLSETIFITGYTGGTLKGAGKGLTILEPSPGFTASDNPWLGGETACILEFQLPTGDISVKALSVVVEGETPAAAHEHSWLGLSTNIDHVFVVQGYDISAEFKDLSIKGEFVGEDVEGAVHGFNVGEGIIATGVAAYGGPINVTIKDCDIEGTGENALDYLFLNGFSEIKDNDISNAYWGLRLNGLWAGQVTVKDNRFENITSDAIWQQVNYGVPVCLKDNTLDGVPLPDDCN
jgi:uncharacterized protein Usg